MDFECKELPTHIGVELGFMSFLCGQEASALRLETASSPRGAATPMERDASRCRATQSSFLNDHLAAWFPRLGRAIQSRARTFLYRDLALLTEAFLIWDASYLMNPRPGDAFFRPSEGPQSNRLSSER